MSRAPSAPPPFSQEDVHVITRKKAAPRGPPPSGMAASTFNAPKHVRSNMDYGSRDYDRRNERYDDEDGRASSGHAHGRGRRNSDSRLSDRGDSISEPNNRNHVAEPKQVVVAEKVSSDRFKITHNVDKLLGNINTWAPTSQCKLFSFSGVLQATYRDLKRFVTRPCDVGIVTRCYIERNRKGSNRLNPIYSLCADLEDGTGRELIVCKKYMHASKSYYIFSLKHDDLTRPREQRSSLYLGKLRSVSDNDYILYDSGSTPVSKGESGQYAESKHNQDSLYRKELLCVHYNNKKRPVQDDSRGMELCIKTVFPDVSRDKAVTNDTSNNSHVYDPNSKVLEIFPGFKEILANRAQNKLYKDKYMVFHERNSKYDALSACLVEYHGRANQVSSKNFQVCVSTPLAPASDYEMMLQSAQDGDGNTKFALASDDASKYIIQMGKTTDDCFNMDYKFPMSMFQAFAVCISRFDANLHS